FDRCGFVAGAFADSSSEEKESGLRITGFDGGADISVSHRKLIHLQMDETTVDFGFDVVWLERDSLINVANCFIELPRCQVCNSAGMITIRCLRAQRYTGGEALARLLEHSQCLRRPPARIPC